MTSATAGYAIKVSWFNVRKHLTKIIGVIGIIVGYALENEATWVAWLSEKHRGTATMSFGVIVFLLGLYNHLYPPQQPRWQRGPFDPVNSIEEYHDDDPTRFDRPGEGPQNSRQITPGP